MEWRRQRPRNPILESGTNRRTYNVSTKLGEFGDCEVRTIAFDEPNLFIKLFNTVKGEHYALVFSDLSFLHLTCDHWQIVLDRLVVYENIVELKVDEFALNFLTDNHIDIDDARIANRKISILSGISGGDILVASANVEEKIDW